jgi:hypothetical protein
VRTEKKNPVYSPVVSVIFFYVSTTEKTLKLRQHENIEAVQEAATMELKAIPEKAFTSCLQDLQKI